MSHGPPLYTESRTTTAFNLPLVLVVSSLTQVKLLPTLLHFTEVPSSFTLSHTCSPLPLTLKLFGQLNKHLDPYVRSQLPTNWLFVISSSGLLHLKILQVTCSPLHDLLGKHCLDDDPVSSYPGSHENEH